MTADPALIELLNQAAEGRTLCPDCTTVILELLDVALVPRLPAPRGPDDGQGAVIRP